jgi:hypothetical protein
MTNLIVKDDDFRKLNALIIFGILFISLFLFMVTPYIFLMFAFIPFLLLREKGVEFDFKSQQIRRYNKSFFERVGYWSDIDKFQFVVILTKTGKKSVSGTLLTSNIRVEGTFYEVYLANESLSKRVFIFSSEKKSKALNTVDTILKNTDLKLK